jgi:hypothetical protein
VADLLATVIRLLGVSSILKGNFRKKKMPGNRSTGFPEYSLNPYFGLLFKNNSWRWVTGTSAVVAT